MDADRELPSRRQVLGGAGAVAVGALLASSVGVRAAEATPDYDPQQRFVRLVPGGNGIIYAAQTDGSLMWYRHAGWATGAATWSNGSGRQIDNGSWQGFSALLADTTGQILAFRPDGTCTWYQWVLTNATTGAGYWAKGSGRIIGRGFDRYCRLFGGWGGQFFAVDASGNLFTYQYTNGSWGGTGSGKKIGSGWSQYPYLFADPGGIIYGVRQGGQLYWWHYLGNGWANRGNAIYVGGQWYEYTNTTLFSNGGGAIYAVSIDKSATPVIDSQLIWYRMTNSTTLDRTVRPNWVRGAETPIGSGFSVCRDAALQGYVLERSVAAGGTVDVAVSSTLGPVSVSILRQSDSATPVTVAGPSTVQAGLQQLPTGYRANGCGWSPNISIPVGQDWPTGVYTAQAQAAGGWQYNMAFVVRPRTPTAPIAFLVPSNTYNAYNGWGGHNQYTPGQSGQRRTVTFQRPNDRHTVEPSGVISHSLYSDLLLLRWMRANGVSVDCYDDGDLDASDSWLSGYRALVIGSHPEYWSDSMRQSVLNYLAAGGRLVSTGGNPLYEHVDFTSDRNALIFRSSSGARDLFINRGEPESQVVGVVHSVATFMTFAPYTVTQSHPVFAGTGLGIGSMFGASGYNGAASGWEVDRRGGLPSDATSAQVIAVGQNPTGGGEMVFRDTPSGGWVFAASSITFNGALSVDPVMGKLMSNVFTMAAAPRPPASMTKRRTTTPPASVPATPVPPAADQP